jgi:oxygen-dependent protoporphyrinogen oxidase
MRVAVVGAGLSGLALAHRLLTLAQARGEPLDLQVLEGSDRAGGNIRTERAGAFVLEAGPNGFVDTVPEMLDLVDELGLLRRLVRAGARARKRFIYRRGRLHAAPLSPPAFLGTSVLSWRGKARLLLEPFVPQKGRTGEEDETIAEFGRRRLGREATAALLDPFVSGVFAGDVEALSAASAFPLLVELEERHGTLFRGMRARAAERRRAGRGPAALTSFRQGMEELSSALEARIAPALRLGARVRALDRRAGAWRIALERGEPVEADRVVLATPSFASAAILEPLDRELAAILSEIPFAPIAVLAVGLRQRQVSHPLDGFGFLVPRGEGLRILGTIFCSSVYEERAPEGSVLLRAFVGGSRDPEAATLPDGALMDLFRSEVGGVLGISGAPVVERIHRYPRAIPQYVRGHAARLRRIAERLRSHDGLFLAGNSYRGVSMNDCVRQATVLAPIVLGEAGPGCV